MLGIDQTNVNDFKTQININDPKEDDQYYIEWGKQWTGRYPFVYAYSNTRFYNTSSYVYEQSWKKYGVLASNFKVGSVQKEELLVGKSSTDIYDFYEQSDVISGITPKPMIQQFSIQKRATNGTLRTIKCKIVCFSYQQFIGIRDYFIIPGTSIFFQYGYTKQSALRNIKAPLSD